MNKLLILQGIDWEKFRPYNWEEIKEEMKEHKIKKRYE